MRGAFDFSSWQGILSTLFGLVVVSLVAVGIRLLVMQSVQRRRERENRQINERLKTLIAAYKTLGGSFTGDLSVDPSHLRELRARADAETAVETPGGERRRRVRDAVEAALSSAAAASAAPSAGAVRARSSRRWRGSTARSPVNDPPSVV